MKMKKILISLVCLLAAVSSYAAKTAKAVMSADKKTLTFYYDEKEHSSEGTVYALNEGKDAPGWIDNNRSVTTAIFDDTFKDARPTSTYKWFFVEEMDSNPDYFPKMTEIKGIENLNTSEVTDMSYMFHGCWVLKLLDLSKFNTAKVTDMKHMFYACTTLTSIDLNGFDTNSVTNMESMFCGCASLKTIYVSENYVTSKVEISKEMFSCCDNLTGGAGTTYSMSNIDATYARIDGGKSSPGYFTQYVPAAIGVVNAVVPSTGAVYNLAGKKVDNSYKGIVVKNGKKIMQK